MKKQTSILRVMVLLAGLFVLLHVSAVTYFSG